MAPLLHVQSTSCSHAVRGWSVLRHFDPFYRRLVRLSRDDPRRALIDVGAMFWLIALGTLAVVVLGIVDVARITVFEDVALAVACLCSAYLAV